MARDFEIVAGMDRYPVRIMVLAVITIREDIYHLDHPHLGILDDFW